MTIIDVWMDVCAIVSDHLCQSLDRPDAHRVTLGELGADNLDTVELILEIETRMDIDLGVDALALDMTVAELAERVDAVLRRPRSAA